MYRIWLARSNVKLLVPPGEIVHGTFLLIQGQRQVILKFLPETARGLICLRGCGAGRKIPFN